MLEKTKQVASELSISQIGSADIKKKFERFSTTKIDGDANVTMDPGRYRPKYDFIKKRSPCAFLGKPKNDDDDIKVNIEKNKNKKRIPKNILKSAYSKNENSKIMICSLTNL